MATAGESRPGSGGKIRRPRRVARVATPYDRPPNPIPRPENPNWISKLILSPTRVIATGADKLLSSVFGPESSSSSSSSSSDSGSDNEIAEDKYGVDRSSLGVDEFNKEAGKPETGRSLGKEPHQDALTSENKLLIEQLIFKETFSWEECERLTNIIKSRVVEAPVNLDREVGRPSEMPNVAAGRALMEAKKWLEEKKSGSIPELDLAPTMLQHVNEGQAGSPVDVAKSFMKERPPWSSPCFNGEAQRSASPIGTRLFKDDDMFSISGNSLSSSKLKRDTPIIGSWNISEEIRRVRSKATEQLLRTPSTKIDLSGTKPKSSATKFDWSGAVLEYKYSLNSSVPSNSQAGAGDKNQTSTNLVDVLSDMPAASTANESPTIEIRSENEAPSVDPSVLISEKNEDLEGKTITRDQGLGDGSGDIKTILPSDTCGASGDIHRDTNASSQQPDDTLPESRLSDEVFPISLEGSGGTGDASVANGIPHSTSRLNAEGRDIRPYDEEQTPPASSLPISQLEDTREPPNGAFAETPNADENDDIVTGSQNSSSMQYEEISQDVSEQSTKQAATPKRGRKVTRFGRKVRGRGK